ncbi:MAG TPA: hypothetical protein VIX73_34350, partial [Kofleriaceae bacterium]
LGRLDALHGHWDAALARCQQLLGDADPSVAQVGAALESRFSSWRRDRHAAAAAAARFASRSEQAARLLAFFERAAQTGELDPAGWAALEQAVARPDHPKRMVVVGFQIMAELSLVFDQPDLALRALGKATEAGLIDLTWLTGCPLFEPVGGDLRWHAIRDEVTRRTAAMLAAFHAAAR